MTDFALDTNTLSYFLRGDVLIAATARRHRRTLVTRNTREFARVAGLALDDWY